MWAEFSFIPKSINIIGTQPEVRAYIKKYGSKHVGYLDTVIWWPGLNDWWVSQIIRIEAYVMAVSDMHKKSNLIDLKCHDRLNNCQSIFAREIKQLKAAHYYERQGWLCPPYIVHNQQQFIMASTSSGPPIPPCLRPPDTR